MATVKRKSDFEIQMYENEAWNRSELICGIDEVGRSCLAGPVVAAAAILKPYATHKYLKDSKLLSPEQRVVAYTWLMKHSIFSVGIVHHRSIDTHNIYQATLRAMKRALVQLLSVAPQSPEIVLVDAMPVLLSSMDISIIYFPFGERQSTSIAAASIIAKVTRDRLMTRMDNVIPGYVFSNNKGYGTKIHKQALEQGGSSIIHRMSFSPLKEMYVEKSEITDTDEKGPSCTEE
ncbi:ribonuclease HII [Candidatus Dependentiae bacterium]|nr:ribonuclease HII [Candidatus Dependentiae bacterium]